jgi:hypothetical protein
MASSLEPKFELAPQSLSSGQIVMFSRKAIIEYPPKKSTADSLGLVEADDHHNYYIKGDAHGRLVRASEWLGCNISEAVGIGTPTPAPIQRMDDTLVFGSRSIAGVADDTLTASYLTTPTISNQGVRSSGLTSILSSIYALDMFINNEDRHLGNYLSIDDNGKRRVYAFDFSRALFWQWPWLSFPQPGQNTRNTIEAFINQMPSDWLPTAVRTEFVAWWASNAKADRLTNIRKGISDGTLL